MPKLVVRYPADELAKMRELFFPEERRSEFTDLPWDGVSFRHYRDPNVVCLEHYTRDKPIWPEAAPKPGHKPAA